MKTKMKTFIAALLACVMVGSGAAGVMASESPDTNDSSDAGNNPEIVTTTAAEEETTTAEEETTTAEEETTTAEEETTTAEEETTTAAEETTTAAEEETTTAAPVVVVEVVTPNAEAIAEINEAAAVTVPTGITNVSANAKVVVSPVTNQAVITVISNAVKALVNETTGVIDIKDDSVKIALKSIGEVVALELDLTDGDTKITQVEGGKIEVTIPINNVLSADTAKVVEYIAVYRAETDDTLTYLGVSPVAADGNIKFQTDHFSNYVFVALDAATDAGDVGTGDFSTSLVFFLIAGVAFVGCVAVLSFKRKNA